MATQHTAGWTRAEIAQLGKGNDREVAARLKRSYMAVQRKRHKLKIAGQSIGEAKRRRWKPAEVKLLGKLADLAVAEQLTISRACVLRERRRRGIGAAHGENTPRKWRRRRRVSGIGYRVSGSG